MTTIVQNVDRVETTRPEIIFVAWPVVDASVIVWTGLYFVDVYYSVIKTMKMVTTIPTIEAK